MKRPVTMPLGDVWQRAAIRQRAGWLADHMRRRPIRTVLAATALASLFLVLFPGIDLRVSAWFHADGGGFPAEHMPVLISLRQLGQAVTRLAAALLAAALLVPLLMAGARFLMPIKSAVFLLSTMALGPGLIVNLGLKNLWGRARPRDIVDFGGQFDFSPAWYIVDYCDRNCSFVSGEGSASIWLLAVALVVPRDRRLPVGLAALAFATVISANRIVFGGHFLSDVLLAWLVTLLVILLVRQALYVTWNLSEERYEAALARWSLAWRRFAAGAFRRAARLVDPAS